MYVWAYCDTNSFNSYVHWLKKLCRDLKRKVLLIFFLRFWKEIITDFRVPAVFFLRVNYYG